MQSAIDWLREQLQNFSYGSVLLKQRVICAYTPRFGQQREPYDYHFNFMAKSHAESIHPRTKRVLDLRECERTRSCWVVKQFVELIIDYGKIKFKRYIRRGGEPADASDLDCFAYIIIIHCGWSSLTIWYTWQHREQIHNTEKKRVPSIRWEIYTQRADGLRVAMELIELLAA